MYNDNDYEFSNFYEREFEEKEKPVSSNSGIYFNSAETDTAVKNKPKKKFFKKAAALLTAIALIAGASYTIGRSSVNQDESVIYRSDSASAQTSQVKYTAADESGKMTVSEVYAANVNSTVGITTQSMVNYFGLRTSAAAAGSGFIISEDGYVVTNYHVVESASEIKVTMYDGSVYDAGLVGYDESNDVAVLKADASGLTPVKIGNSDSAVVGDEVAAIGNPLGELTFTLTRGVISAIGREVTLSSGVTMNLIQTDAAINSGNSGGALFNMYGELIGITNAKYSSSSSGEASIDNIGFAIPINSVLDIIEDIIQNGTRSNVSQQNPFYGYYFSGRPYSG